MKKSATSNKSLTDWERVDSMAEEDIDLSDSPEISPEMFAGAVVRRGLEPSLKKVQLTLRVDSDVLDWFKSRGRGLPDTHQCAPESLHGSSQVMIDVIKKKYVEFMRACPS